MLKSQKELQDANRAGSLTLCFKKAIHTYCFEVLNAWNITFYAFNVTVFSKQLEEPLARPNLIRRHNYRLTSTHKILNATLSKTTTSLFFLSNVCLGHYTLLSADLNRVKKSINHSILPQYLDESRTALKNSVLNVFKIVSKAC